MEPCPQPRAHAADVRQSGGYDVPREQWSAFLRRLAERLAGVSVGVGIAQASAGESLQRRRCLPFHGARVCRRVDGRHEILITLGEPPYMLEPYFVIDPVRVRLEQDAAAQLVMRIESERHVLVLCFEPSRVSTGPLALLG